MAAGTEPLSLASKLCLACGLCCDSTVYPHAVAREDELAQAMALGFTTIRTENGYSAFELPCHYLEGRACTRYRDWRPSVCGDYFCRVQARAGSGEITEDEALALIAKAQDLRDAMAAQLPNDIPRSHARQYLETISAKRGQLDPAEATFAVRLFVLERFLDAEFRLGDRDRLMARRSMDR